MGGVLMLLVCRYNTSNGKITTILRGMTNDTLRNKLRHDSSNTLGIIKRLPSGAASLSTNNMIELLRVKHANPDGTVELEYGKDHK
jgi:hypothetical protein